MKSTVKSSKETKISRPTRPALFKHHADKITKVSQTAKRVVIKIKMEEVKREPPTVKWGELPAGSCWTFQYLVRCNIYS